MKKTPLQIVKERFASKDKLVAAVNDLKGELWLDRANEAKGLERVSNAKLLRLHELLSDAQKQFKSRDKLVGTILALENREKDEGYKARLTKYPLPRLLDVHRAASLRASRVTAASAPTKKKRAPRSKKAKAKAKAA